MRDASGFREAGWDQAIRGQGVQRLLGAHHRPQLIAAARVGSVSAALPPSFFPGPPVSLRKVCASTQGEPGAPGEAQLTRSDRRSLVADGGGLVHGRPTVHHECSVGAGMGTGQRADAPRVPDGGPSRREEHQGDSGG